MNICELKNDRDAFATDDLSIEREFVLLTGILKDCLAFLSTQDLAPLLDDILDYILTDDEYLGHKDNPIPQIFCNHPEAQWFITEIRNVFKLLVLPKIAVGCDLCQYKSDYVHQIIQQVSIRLYKRLECLTSGLDCDFITSLSGTVYESNSTNGETIALLPSIDWLQKNVSVSFDETSMIVLDHNNVRAIRKQLNMGGDGALAICKNFDDGHFYTVGIISPELSAKLPRFVFPRHLEWFFSVPAQNSSDHSCTCSRIRYCNGSLMLPLLTLQSEILFELHKFGYTDEIANKLLTIIDATNQCQHGAVLIIADADTIDAECRRLVKLGKRGILLKSPITIFNRDSTSPYFKQFASIDGAVLADDQGLCYACGVILDGEIQTEGTPARGSRFNSIKTYTEWLKSRYPSAPILGIVKSEDGMLNMFNGCLQDFPQESD